MVARHIPPRAEKTRPRTSHFRQLMRNPTSGVRDRRSAPRPAGSNPVRGRDSTARGRGGQRQLVPGGSPCRFLLCSRRTLPASRRVGIVLKRSCLAHGPPGPCPEWGQFSAGVRDAIRCRPSTRFGQGRLYWWSGYAGRKQFRKRFLFGLQRYSQRRNCSQSGLMKRRLRQLFRKRLLFRRRVFPFCG